MTIEQDIPLGTNFVAHKNLPNDFLVAGVRELIASGASVFSRSWEGREFYFTRSENGINLRSEEQWRQRRMNSIVTGSDGVERIRLS
ncbi:hypothetical protein [Pseudomonas sp.]|uniref:hypothetical protein n=1 Tax=Pseudomonas sp. TaxID=306 RepID=UPI0028A822AE|nr:hypothetical protein [Pseudomonas sp.]